MAARRCVNCGAWRQDHHRDGWCFWISDTDHLPIQYSATEVTLLQLVDDNGEALVAPPDVEEPCPMTGVVECGCQECKPWAWLPHGQI